MGREGSNFFEAWNRDGPIPIVARAAQALSVVIKSLSYYSTTNVFSSLPFFATGFHLDCLKARRFFSRLFFQTFCTTCPYLGFLLHTETHTFCALARWNVSQGFVSLWKCRPTKWFCKFWTISHMNLVFFIQPIGFLGPNKVNRVEKDWNHVRKCQKFAKSLCRPRFSKRNKTLEIPQSCQDFS